MRAINISEDSACAILIDGTAWCWGGAGQLGNGVHSYPTPTPVKVSGLLGAAVNVYVDAYFGCALSIGRSFSAHATRSHSRTRDVVHGASKSGSVITVALCHSAAVGGTDDVLGNSSGAAAGGVLASAVDVPLVRFVTVHDVVHPNASKRHPSARWSIFWT